MTTLDDLISRVREAREGSRELDHDITLLLCQKEHWAEVLRGYPGTALHLPSTPQSPCASGFCRLVVAHWNMQRNDAATIGPDYNSPVHGERLHGSSHACRLRIRLRVRR